jgi:cell division protein FtsL
MFSWRYTTLKQRLLLGIILQAMQLHCSQHKHQLLNADNTQAVQEDLQHFHAF